MRQVAWVFAALLLASGALQAQIQWGNEPGQPQSGFGRAQKPAPAPQAGTAASCYAYRTKGSDQHQIACYGDAASCDRSKADYQRKNPSIETLGCAPQIYCFTYNAGGKSSACYLGANECVQRRNELAARGGSVGACVANNTAGSPKTQLAQGSAPSAFGQPKTPPPPPPPGVTQPKTASAAGVCNPSKMDGRPKVSGVERCFGAIGQGCKSQIEYGLFQAPPMNWQQAVPQPNCTIQARVSVGSIIHDNCCKEHPEGLYCTNDPGQRLQDEISDLPCHREWRKAVYDTLQGRFWFETFGPYYENNNGDDMRILPSTPQRPMRQAVTYGPGGVQDAPIASAVTERNESRRLSAPSGTKLEIGDVAFCKSGRFREEGWCDPIGGAFGCSSTRQLCESLYGDKCLSTVPSGKVSYAEWEQRKSCGLNPACGVEAESQKNRWRNRVQHWGICE